MARIRRILSVFMATLFLTSSLVTNVFAESQSIKELEANVYEYVGDSNISTYATTFDEASITISYTSNGMEVLILTHVNGVASVVGVKDIKIQVKNGNDWTTVATSAGGELTDVRGMACEVTYAGAIEGQTYRVTCIHYADVEGYREAYHESVGMLCQY